MHIRDTDDERVLFVDRTGNLGRTIVVQFDTHDCGAPFAYHFELTDLERKALIQALTLPTDAPAPICYEGDHVPGCEHQAVNWFDVGVAILGMGDPPLEGPPADEEHHADPLDDPVGHGEPAF